MELSSKGGGRGGGAWVDYDGDIKRLYPPSSPYLSSEYDSSSGSDSELISLHFNAFLVQDLVSKG